MHSFNSPNTVEGISLNISNVPTYAIKINPVPVHFPSTGTKTLLYILEKFNLLELY